MYVFTVCRVCRYVLMYEYMYVWMLVRITVKQKATTKNSQKTVMIHTEMKKAIEAEQKMLEEKHPG